MTAPFRRVACLAALAAMGHGRRRLYLMTEALPNGPAGLVAARSSVLRFWELLEDFAALGLVHRRNRQSLT